MLISYEAGPADGPVLVTGATGYLAGWVVKLLLDAGITVHATVRDPDNRAKVQHLLDMADASTGALKLFRADLLDAGSHEAAMQGCRIVMHTASPFLAPGKFTDPQRDFVEPALQGTRDILETANRVASVERIVLTSSTVAVYDRFRTGQGPGTEADWNTSATLENAPYPYSKVVAEQEAWRIAGDQERWKLVVINPGFILGPGTAPTQTSASFDHMRKLVDGSYAQGLPVFDVGSVDVVDVAEAHMRGAFLPDAHGRNIVFAEILSLNDIARIVKGELGEENYSFAPDTPWNPELPHWSLDNGKSIRELGMQYRPLKPAIVAMFLQATASPG